MTPLHLACSAISQDGPEMVEWLLDHGADPSIQDNVGPNVLPINWAVHNNRPRSLAYLIDRGHGTDLQGCLQHAIHCGHRKVVDVLLKAGADPNVNTRKGGTMVQIAKEAGHDDLATYLEGL